MTWRVRVISDADEYEKRLPPASRRLFDRDKAKLSIDPYDPPGLKSRPYQGQRDVRTASCAGGKLLIQYRVRGDLIEVHILKILP